MCSEAGTGKSGSQKQEGRSYPCPGGGGGVDVRQGQQDFIFLYELQTLAAWQLLMHLFIFLEPWSLGTRDPGEATPIAGDSGPDPPR